jgi:signal transduction histidine kinase
MPTQKPETLALSAAMAGTLIVLFVFVVDLTFVRHNDLEVGERRLQQFGIMMSEHTARTFEAIDVLLRDTATDLSGDHRDWETWPSPKGWEYIAQRHSRSLPQLRDLIVFDRHGNQRFVSTQYPTPQVNVKDRPYFVSLEGGAEAVHFGPYVGRNSGRYTYALSRRLTGSNGIFSGAVFAAIEPTYLQEFCWPNRLSDDFEAVLTNALGEIIASCRPSDTSRQSSIHGAKASNVLFDGKLRGQVPASGMAKVDGLLVSVSEVPGFSDMRILTVIPEKTILAAWRTRLLELTTLGMLVTVVLLIGALLVRRQVRELSTMTEQLATSHEHLEERVRTATLELAGRKDAAERANAAKSRFLAAASHDLRQPLHALSLFSADLQRQVRSGSSSELPRLAEQISVSTAMLGELLDSLLDISRLDVSGIKPDRRPFPVQPLFERIATSFKRAAADRNITLRFRPSLLWVDSDPLLLDRMIANLVSNALRYTMPGGSVLVVARRRGRQVLVEVRDNGIGIAREHQASIFAEFYQIGNTAREHNKGLGLGLSIVDRLARALGIQVALRSRLGDGTVFSLNVPGSLPEAAPRPGDSAAPVAGKVHCVGNSAEMQASIELFKGWGYAVTVSEDGSQRSPDNAVLIADANLAVAVSAEHASDTPMIVLAATVDQPLPVGAHVLPIPVRAAKLRALLNQLQKTLSKSIP